MTHLAIHDALNAIDRRSRPYAFSAKAANGGASPEAAVAAAAHDVLVPCSTRSPHRSRRRAARRAPRASKRTTRRRSPPFRTVGQGPGDQSERPPPRRPRPARRGRRGHAAGRHGLPAGHESRRVPLHTRDPVRVRTRLGGRHAVRAARQLAVPSRPARRGDVEEVHGRIRRGEAARRRRRHHAQRPHRRANRDRPLLGRELPAAVNRIARTVSTEQRLDCGSRRACSACSTWRWPTAMSARSTPNDYNYWRPVTAIQAADTDGNPDTSADPTWTPLGRLHRSRTTTPLTASKAEPPPGSSRASSAPTALLHNLQPDPAARKHLPRFVAGCAPRTASPKPPRRTENRASSSASTSAGPSSKGSTTEARSATERHRFLRLAH